MTAPPIRKCQGPHGWCGELATVVCTAADKLQWFACDRDEHHVDDEGRKASLEPIGGWFTRNLGEHYVADLNVGDRAPETWK